MATDLLILRDQIDAIDKQIVELYEKRVEVCKEVAEYKIEKVCLIDEYDGDDGNDE